MNRYSTRCLPLLVVIIASATDLQAQTNSRPAVVRTNVVLEAKKLQLLAVREAMSTYRKCDVVVDGSRKTVWLSGLPPETAALHERMVKLATELERRRTALKAEATDLRSTMAETPALATSSSSAGRAIRQINIRNANLENNLTNLAEDTETLKSLQEVWKSVARLEAFDPGQTYGGFKIMIVKR